MNIMKISLSIALGLATVSAVAADTVDKLAFEQQANVIEAYDGIFIGGGIVARKPELIASSRFRIGFERKGRHRALMERIPTQVILHPQPGLLGASYRALRTFRDEN